MPRSAEQYEDIRKEKTVLILDTALELFGENGYHATSVSQIAKKAGISKGLTYNYFKSKKDILDAVVQHGFNEIYSHFDHNKDGILTKDEFIFFIKQNFKVLRNNNAHWKLFYSLMLQPTVAKNFSSDYKEHIDPISNILQAFIQSQGSTDPEGDLMAISAMLEGAFLYTVTAPDVFPAQMMEDKIIQACFKIISTQPLGNGNK